MSAKSSIESKLSNLHIDLPKAAKFKPSTNKEDVVDSWEDDLSEVASSAQTPTEGPGPSLKPIISMDPALNPPPPTPISPGNGGQYVDWSSAQVLGGGRPSNRPHTPPTPSTPQTDSDRDRRRPEKTTATASRMIAAGLGIKAPRKTEEQRQYDRAVRDQEIKRKNREKEDKEREREADEQAKASVWDS